MHSKQQFCEEIPENSHWPTYNMSHNLSIQSCVSDSSILIIQIAPMLFYISPDMLEIKKTAVVERQKNMMYTIKFAILLPNLLISLIICFFEALGSC